MATGDHRHAAVASEFLQKFALLDAQVATLRPLALQVATLLDPTISYPKFQAPSSAQAQHNTQQQQITIHQNHPLSVEDDALLLRSFAMTGMADEWRNADPALLDLSESDNDLHNPDDLVQRDRIFDAADQVERTSKKKPRRKTQSAAHAIQYQFLPSNNTNNNTSTLSLTSVRTSRSLIKRRNKEDAYSMDNVKTSETDITQTAANSSLNFTLPMEAVVEYSQLVPPSRIRESETFGIATIGIAPSRRMSKITDGPGESNLQRRASSKPSDADMASKRKPSRVFDNGDDKRRSKSFVVGDSSDSDVSNKSNKSLGESLKLKSPTNRRRSSLFKSFGNPDVVRATSAERSADSVESNDSKMCSINVVEEEENPEEGLETADENEEATGNPNATSLDSSTLAPTGVPRKLIAATRIKRRASKIANAFQHAATSPKYNIKGSLASMVFADTKQSQADELQTEDEAPLGGKEVMIDDEESENPKPLIFETGFNFLSSVSVNFDLFMSILYIIILIGIPMVLAFQLDGAIWMSISLSSVFGVDSIMELFTPKPSYLGLQANKEPNLRMWQFYYIKYLLAWELLTAFPFELLPFPNAQYLLCIRLLRLYKLPQIMERSPKYKNLIKFVQNFFGIGQTVTMILPLFLSFCMYLHLQACTLFLVGRLLGYKNPEISSVAELSPWRQYTWGLFSAIGNTFPMAYKPTDMYEQWMVLLFILIGAIFYASLVGAISSFAMSLDASGRLYKQKLDELKEYMRWKDLGPTTRKKILKYYDLKYRGKFFEESTLLNEMNSSLRMEIAAHNCRELISKVSFLRRCQHDGRDELYIGRIATALTPCFYVPGDIIITQGEMANDMYFVMRGKVHVIVGGRRVASMKEGSFFGEVALIANIPRTATVQAAASCMLYRLTRASFTSILTEFDDVKRRVDAIYKERMAKIRQEEEARKLLAAREIATKVTYLKREENDGRDADFLMRIAVALIAAFVDKDEIVFAQGDFGNEMYFVKSGSVAIIVNGRQVATLSEGAFFGEVSLIANIPRTATVQAAEPCMLYKLTRQAFNSILEEFKDMKARIDVVYQQRMLRVKAEEEERKMSLQ